jgi:hypothetical protein
MTPFLRRWTVQPVLWGPPVPPFTRDALRAALTSIQEKELERRHRAGYERKPVKPGEFSDWDVDRSEGAEFEQPGV